MPISSCSTFLIEREASTRFKDSYGQMEPTLPHVIVKITDESGVWGWGEASPLSEFTGETAAGIRLALEASFLPALIGKDAFDTALIHQELSRLPLNTSAKAAVDMALYDLQGKLLGLPACRLLGGVCRGSVPVSRPIGIEPADAAVKKALGYVKLGHKTLKLKVGEDYREDIKRVHAVREAVGGDIAIRIDGNQGFDFPTALQICRALEKCDIQYFEQPLPAWDHEGMARLRMVSGFRLAADESLHSLRDAMSLIRHNAADVFIIKFIKTSGLTMARQIAAVAGSAGIRCVVVSPFDTQIGAAAGLHFALATPNADLANELTVFAAQPDMAVSGHRVENGCLIPGLEPGFGVSSISEIGDFGNK